MSSAQSSHHLLTPISPDVFREACAHLATSVAVATVLAKDGSPHGLTISSFVSVSLDPPLVLICIDSASGVHETFTASAVFAINVLSQEQKQLSIDFAAEPEGRFDHLEWRVQVTGAPVIAGVLAWLDCRVVDRITAGDHSIFIGEVVSAGWKDGLPLIHFSRNYHVLR